MSTPNAWPAFLPTDDPLDVIVKLSRFYGSDPEFVLAGGDRRVIKVFAPAGAAALMKAIEAKWLKK